MPKTRSKRAADTTEPTPVEPAKKRQSKRAKKEPVPEPEPVVEEPELVVEESIPAVPQPEPEPEPEPTKEGDKEPINDIPIDEEEVKEDYVEEALKEEPRASDLYLDTVSILQTNTTPYLSTKPKVLLQINRVVLDFDFEKVCSVSTLNFNIYGCLVCGKYFQGRGRNSHAYAHSIDRK